MSKATKAAGRGPELPDGEPTSIVRRVPFADSPFVGERGQQAQLRILEAALVVFGDVGYHGCGVKRITEVSGCSRAAFYQYFSSKEDLFRHLAGRVARELTAVAGALQPISPDRAGWDSLHGWLRRYSELYDTYEPVFLTFQTAAASDAMVASGASVVADRTFHDLRSKIVGSELPPAQIETVVRTLFRSVGRLNRETSLLERAAPAMSLDRDRANVAYTDFLHRALFVPDPPVNVHTPATRARRVRAPAPLTATLDVDADPTHGPAAQRTRAQLVDAGHRVFIERGYYATNVADIVQAVGVSHGVFYRYFENKTHLFRILAERASVQLNDALRSLPDSFATNDATAPDDLRAWLRRYADTYASEAAIFTMWSEAITRDADLGEASAAVLDRSRAQLAHFLAPRGWGDADADALVLLAVLDGMTAQSATPARIDSSARVIERGLLTGPAAPPPRPRSAKPEVKTRRTS